MSEPAVPEPKTLHEARGIIRDLQASIETRAAALAPQAATAHAAALRTRAETAEAELEVARAKITKLEAVAGKPSEVPASYQVRTLQEAREMIARLHSTAERRALELAAGSMSPQAAAELRTRAESAETHLAAAQTRIAELEAAERTSDLGQQLAAVTCERDSARAGESKANALMELLEGALNVKGITSAQAVPAMREPGPRTSIADFERRIQSTQNAGEQAAISAEFERAFSEGRIAR